MFAYRVVGAMDRGEVRMLAVKLGSKLSNEQLDAAMEAMDADGSGEVDFGEFYLYWSSSKASQAHSLPALTPRRHVGSSLD